MIRLRVFWEESCLLCNKTFLKQICLTVLSLLFKFKETKINYYVLLQLIRVCVCVCAGALKCVHLGKKQKGRLISLGKRAGHTSAISIVVFSCRFCILQ